MGRLSTSRWPLLRLGLTLTVTSLFVAAAGSGIVALHYWFEAQRESQTAGLQGASELVARLSDSSQTLEQAKTAARGSGSRLQSFNVPADLRLEFERTSDSLKANDLVGYRAALNHLNLGLQREKVRIYEAGSLVEACIVGFLSLASLVGAVFASKVGRSLVSAAAANDLERERLEKTTLSLNKIASTDKLTGLPNRRSFEGKLDAEFARSQRTRVPAAVVVADLDHFKKINDVYGHDTGDLVLERVARVFESGLRPYDAVARYGGEEFTFLLPGATVEDAQNIVGRIQGLLGQIDVGCGPVTCSFGIAHLNQYECGSEALKAADRALYQAKANGRARYETAA